MLKDCEPGRAYLSIVQMYHLRGVVYIRQCVLRAGWSGHAMVMGPPASRFVQEAIDSSGKAIRSVFCLHLAWSQRLEAKMPQWTWAAMNAQLCIQQHVSCHCQHHGLVQPDPDAVPAWLEPALLVQLQKLEFGGVTGRSDACSAGNSNWSFTCLVVYAALPQCSSLPGAPEEDLF